MSTRLRRRAPLVLTALIAVAIAVPATAFGIHQFSDVPDSNPFHADIDALADSGVTTGCGSGIYCPDGFVTREQMAAFMNRLGALSPSKTPVVNADKLDGIDSTGFVKTSDAIDADTLGGVGPFGYLPAATITMTQYGGWTGSSFTFTDSNSNIDVTKAASGSGVLHLGLHGPESIGGFGYALQSVTVCFAANANVTITGMNVYKIEGAVTSATIGDASDTVLTAATCRTLTDPVPDPSGSYAWHLTVSTDWLAGGLLEIGVIRTTWANTTLVG